MGNQVNCGTFENRVQALMDQRTKLATDHELRLHAQSCSDCNELLNHFSALETALEGAFSSDEFLMEMGAVEGNQFSEPLALRMPEPKGVTSTWIAAAALAVAATFLLFMPMLMQVGSNVEIADNSASARANSSLRRSNGAPSSDFNTGGKHLVVYDTLPNSLRNAYQYAVELPGIKPIECSVNATLEMLQKSLGPFGPAKPTSDSPDLGHFESINLDSLA